MSRDTEVIGVPEAAKRRGVTPHTIRNWIVEGLLPAERFGRDYMIRAIDLAKVPVRKPGPKPRADRAA